jgi:hypothetical protein
MKNLTNIIASFFLLTSFTTHASLIVTIGDVTGTNTLLTLSIEGGGTLSSDLETAGTGSLGIYTDFSGTIDSSVPNTRVSLVGDGVGFFADNDIGEYVDNTYRLFSGERLVNGIAVNNITDSTLAMANWLNFDSDGVGFDDFAVILDSTDNSLFDVGDVWSVSGLSTIQLQRGDASDFVLGTYSYQDNALGMVTLIIQENSVLAVSEPGTFALLGISLVGMGLIRRRNKANL